MKSNCCIYVRVSTIDKQETSRQINDLETFANTLNFNVAGVFEDKITGSSKASDRHDFSKMDRFIQLNGIKNLLVWELSRLGRSMDDVINIVRDYNARGICIWFYNNAGLKTLNEKGEEDTLAMVMISVISGFAQMEKELIQARVVSGLASSVRQGGAGGGIKAYGFKSVNKKLTIDNDEAEVVKKVFDLYTKGLGTARIANYLNHNNIPTRYSKHYAGSTKIVGGREKSGSDFKWRDATVYSMLKNELYVGKRRYKDTTYEIPSIVEPSVFSRVQKMLTDNYNKKGINSKYQNILREKIVCGKCSLTYFMHKRSNNKDNAYKCLSKRYNESCGNPSISIDKLNNAMFYILSNKIQMDIATGSIGKDQKIESLETDIEFLEAEIAETNSGIEKCNSQRKNLIQVEISSSNFRITDLKEAYSTIEEKEATLSEKLLELSETLNMRKESLTSLKKIRNLTLTDENLFKEYAKDYINEITLYDLGDSHDLYDQYPNKMDNQIVAKVELSMGGFYYFILSQRTNYMLLLDYSSDLTFDSLLTNIGFMDTYKVEIPSEVNV